MVIVPITGCACWINIDCSLLHPPTIQFAGKSAYAGPIPVVQIICVSSSHHVWEESSQLNIHAALGNTSPTFRSLFSSPSARALMPYASFTGTCLIATATFVGTCTHTSRIEESRTECYVLCDA